MLEKCPKCGSCNISAKTASFTEFGLSTLKGLTEAGYWGVRVVSGITENLGHPGMLASGISRCIGGVIKSGADAIPTNATKYKCNKCGHTWGLRVYK